MRLVDLINEKQFSIEYSMTENFNIEIVSEFWSKEKDTDYKEGYVLTINDDHHVDREITLELSREELIEIYKELEKVLKMTIEEIK